MVSNGKADKNMAKDVEEALNALLASYRRYYDVKTEGVAPPFVAEAVFNSHDEQFFLSRRVTLAESESHEYVFIAAEELVDLASIQRLDEAAWAEGLSRVKPHFNHRNSDIVLAVLAERISPEAKAYLRSVMRYQSYCLTFKGWSHYSVAALEVSSGEFLSNKRGRALKNVFCHLASG